MHASRFVRAVTVMSSAVALGSCGGDGSSDMPPPPSDMRAPASLSYSTPQTYIVNSPIPALSPSVVGTVTSYTVTHTLPAGLTLNAGTGVISGTPTQPSAQASYSITASNAVGSTKFAVVITVDAGIAYASSYYSFTKGVASNTIAPVAAAPGASWSVTPTLPAGLMLDTTNGDISGTPSAASSAAPYVVTAKTSGGKSSVTLTLAVAAGPLLDLGHAAPIVSVRLVGSRLLTEDDAEHWVLWDYTADANLANGTTPSLKALDLEGSTVVIQSPSGLEVLSATDGTVQAQIAVSPSWWRLATDGSYIVTGSATGLTVYSPTGTVVLTHPGNYANALAFAAPTQLLVALGAAGASVIEYIAVPSATTSVGPAFLGTFQSWFLDGSRFLTANGNTVWVYPQNYNSQNDFQGPVALPTVAGLAGTGNWFWTFDGTLTVYQVGVTGNSPAPSYTAPCGVAEQYCIVPTLTTIGLLTSFNLGATLTVVDLSNSSAVSATNYTAPVQLLLSYGASSSSTWVVGNVKGVLYDGASAGGTPRYLDYGALTGVAAGSNDFAVATASNRILYFNATNSALEGTLNQLTLQGGVDGSSVQLSADGTVLAAVTNGTQPPDLPTVSGVINIFTLPAGTLTASLPFAPPETVSNMSLSGSGTVLGAVHNNASACTDQVLAIPSGSTLLCATPTVTSGSVLPSADGTGIATAPLYNPDYSENGGSYSTNIYINGTLATAVPGIVQAWLSPTTVLVASYEYTGPTPVGEFDQYVSSSIYNVSGSLVSSLNLPNTGPVQTLSSMLVYSLSLNAIYSVAPGAGGTAIWSSGSAIGGTFNPYRFGAATGSEVVFPSNNLVLAEPFP